MIPSPKYEPGLAARNDILTTLAYFDIFSYPLKKREIWLFLRNSYDNADFEIALSELLETSAIYLLDEFYSLRNDHVLAERRRKGNEKAKELMITAGKVANLISKFPYVRGVGVSGSLSKNFGDENSDIDLFVITAKNRLWIARTFLHCFKKFTFLFNKQHLFCMNYFVDEENNEIEEKNIYTATEVATLVPLQGSIAFTEFYSNNAWTKNFLPNNYMRVASGDYLKGSWYKWLLEKLFNNAAGNVFDNLLMRTTKRRWLAKTNKKKLNNRGVVMGMSATKSCAKPDPRNFQQKLLNIYNDKVSAIVISH